VYLAHAPLGDLGIIPIPATMTMLLRVRHLKNLFPKILNYLLPAVIFSPAEIADFNAGITFARTKPTSIEMRYARRVILHVKKKLLAHIQTAPNATEKKRRQAIYRLWDPVSDNLDKFLLAMAIIVTAGIATAPAAAGGGAAAGGAAGVAPAIGVAPAVGAAPFAVTGTLLETIAVTAAPVLTAGQVAVLGTAALGTAALVGVAPGTTVLEEITVTGAAPGFVPVELLPALPVAVLPGGWGSGPSSFEKPLEFPKQPALPKTTQQILSDQLKATLKKYAIEKGTEYAMQWYAERLQRKMVAAEERALQAELERLRAEYAAQQKQAIASGTGNARLIEKIVIALALRWGFG